MNTGATVVWTCPSVASVVRGVRLHINQEDQCVDLLNPVAQLELAGLSAT